MIKEGIKEGKLTRDKVIMDSSSGNTGIAYAMIGAAARLPSGAGHPRKCWGKNAALLKHLAHESS